METNQTTEITFITLWDKMSHNQQISLIAKNFPNKDVTQIKSEEILNFVLKGFLS